MLDVRVRQSGSISRGGRDANATAIARREGHRDEDTSFGGASCTSPFATRISVRCCRHLRRGADIRALSVVAPQIGSIHGTPALDSALIALYRAIDDYAGVARLRPGPAGRPADAALVGH